MYLVICFSPHLSLGLAFIGLIFSVLVLYHVHGTLSKIDEHYNELKCHLTSDSTVFVGGSYHTKTQP